MLKKLFLISFLLSLALPVAVFGQVDGGCTEYCNKFGTPEEIPSPENRTCICNPLEAKDFNEIVDSILNFLFRIAVVLVPLMAVIAGFMLITAAGNPEKINRARDIIIWTAVGLGILLLSRGILAIINQLLGVTVE